MSYLEDKESLPVLEKEILVPATTEAEGKDLKYPQRLDNVEVFYKMLDEDGNIIDTTEADPEPETETQDDEKKVENEDKNIKDDFPLVHKNTTKLLVGDPNLLKGLNIALTQISIGEKAVFKIPGNLAFTDGNLWGAKPKRPISIELQVYQAKPKIPTKFDIEVEERPKFAQKFKEEATEFHKKSDFKKAEILFERALDFVEWEKGEEVVDLKVKLLLNITLIAKNSENYIKALSKINWAINLSPTNSKCYYRKGAIYEAQHDFDEAIFWYKKGLEIEPGNKDLKIAIKKVYQKKKEYQQKGTEMFSRILKHEIYEEKVLTPYSDSLNRMVTLELETDGDTLDLRIELFSNIVPDCVNFFEDVIVGKKSGEILKKVDFKKNNFVIFGPVEPIEEKEEPENFSISFNKEGYLYFVCDEEGKYSGQVGISLAPLIWFNKKHAIFAHISSSNNWHERIQNVKDSISLRVNQESKK